MMQQNGSETLAELRAELDATRAAAAASAGDAAVLADLVNTLRWDGAPQSLRLVLPLARLLRRARGRVAERGASPASATPAAPPGQRRSLPTRIAVRLYMLTRPVSLPVARRLHRLLSRLLEKEQMLSQRDAATGSAAAPATADLIRSIEAAMLTLALQRRERP